MTVNESQMEIPAERGQDFVWHVNQRSKKAYLKFDVSENWENVECEWAEYVEAKAYIVCKFLLHKSRLGDKHGKHQRVSD